MKNNIVIFPTISNNWKEHKIDNFEVHPCREIDTGHGRKTTVEQCEREDAEFWSVYVHFKNGGLECIADCETEAEANQLEKFLREIVNRFEI